MTARKRAGYDARIGKRHLGPDGRTGILTDVLRGTAYLRPERGGQEWTVPIEDVQPVGDKAEDFGTLSARVAEASRRSRGEL